MDSTAVADIFEALTGATPTDRFLTSLAASPPLNFVPNSSEDYFNTLHFDMPLAHALASSEPPHIPLAAALLPNPQPRHDITNLEPNRPISTLTAQTFHTTMSSSSRHGRITKRKARSPPPIKYHFEQPFTPINNASITTRNISVASDVSTQLSPPTTSPKQLARPFQPTQNLQSPTSYSHPKPEPQILHNTSHSNHSPFSPTSRKKSRPTKSENSASALPMSHTRRCREKVTRQLEHLLEVLPVPPRGVEVRHKAQILEYTISVFRSMLARRTLLQTHIALASKNSIREWANATLVAAAASAKPQSFPELPSLTALLDPFMGFYCVKNKWAYAETWTVTPTHASLPSCVVNSEEPQISSMLNAFADQSKNRFQLLSEIKSGIISRVRRTKRPEWLSDLPTDPSVFDRTVLAARHGLQVAFAVPIVVHNECLSILVFADVKPRSYSASDADQLYDYAVTLGECYTQYSSNYFPSQQNTSVPVVPNSNHVLHTANSVEANSNLEILDNREDCLATSQPWSMPPLVVTMPQSCEESSRNCIEEATLLV